MAIWGKSQLLKIPVKLVGGKWEFFYGGAVPVKEGAIADLVLETKSIEDEQFLADVTKPFQVLVLEEGTELRVAVTFKDGLPSGMPKPYLPSGRSPPGLEFDDMQIGDYEFVKQSTYFYSILIGEPSSGQKAKGIKKGGVWLLLKGFDVTGLITSTISTDVAISKEPLISLNHALTKFSEKYEPWRISHTGNVYQSVYYLEGDRHWYPLEYLRNRELAKAELSVVSELWGYVAREMKLPYSGKPKKLKLK